MAKIRVLFCREWVHYVKHPLLDREPGCAKIFTVYWPASMPVDWRSFCEALVNVLGFGGLFSKVDV